MKFLQFLDKTEVGKILYAKDQVVRFTDENLAFELISKGAASEITFEYGAFVDHEINVGRIAAE